MGYRQDMLGTDVVPVTPNDVTPVGFIAIYVGTGGNLTVQHKEGTSVLYKNTASGWVLSSAPIVRVMATGTTATDLLGIKP